MTYIYEGDTRKQTTAPLTTHTHTHLKKQEHPITIITSYFFGLIFQGCRQAGRVGEEAELRSFTGLHWLDWVGGWQAGCVGVKIQV